MSEALSKLSRGPSVVVEAMRKVGPELAMMDGFKSKSDLLRLRVERFRKGEADVPPQETVALRVKPLGGYTLHFRPRTSDLDMLVPAIVETRNQPPPELGEIRRIVEVGTNVGVSVCVYAHRFPQAKVLGVEPDPGNCAVARLNMAPLGDRGMLIEAAAWETETELTVERDHREWGLVVRERSDDDPPDWPRIPARSLNSMLAEFAGDEPIDYIFVDVEGSEMHLLERNTEWAERVRAITVEVEVEYDGDVGAVEQALRALGYGTVRRREQVEQTWVTGIR